MRLEVANEGVNDLPAPLLLITSSEKTPLGTALPVLSNRINDIYVLVLGPAGRTDVLAPGQRTTVPFYAKGVEQPNAVVYLQDAFEPNTPIDWDAFEGDYYDETDEQWAEVWQVFKQDVGSTMGSFCSALRHTAAELAPAAHEKAYLVEGLILQLLANARVEVGN